MADETLKPDLWYLATPYTKFPFGIEHAAHVAAKLAGRLIYEGENVYSPIAHSHMIAHCAGINPLDHDFWIHVDKAFMHKCDGLIVAMLPTWTQSKGVRIEIDTFKLAGKPIRYYDPEINKFVSEALN